MFGLWPFGSPPVLSSWGGSGSQKAKTPWIAPAGSKAAHSVPVTALPCGEVLAGAQVTAADDIAPPFVD